MKYPIIKYPNSFLKILTEEESFTKKPPIEPKPPIKSNGIFGILTIIGILLGFWLSGGLISWITALITFSIFFILDILFFIRTSKFASMKNKYQKDQYIKDLDEYKSELRYYKHYLNLIALPGCKKSFRQKKLKETINNTTLPTKKYPNINKGISEDFFYSYLIKYFPNKIFRGYIIEEFEGKKPYIPDFIFQDISTNLHIDIEIDEPYDFKTGVPTHYIYLGESHFDNGRDNYFNYFDWVVIRFSENQIIHYPDDCCKLILAIIDNIFDLNFQNQLDCFNYLSEDCWDKDSAINLFKNKSRSNLKIKSIESNNYQNNEKIKLGDYFSFIPLKPVENIHKELEDLPF